uniref:Neuregulin 2b n=1 Tax=Salmo trutta TaxID=8032 RepID=A0A673VTP7_SALTR
MAHPVLSLMEGERLYLKCEASGNPSPSFRWYKDGRELQRGKDVKIKTNKKNSKVQINRARLEDSGNYTCVVENMLGQESTTSSISVQSLTTTLSPGSSHARRCNDTEKSYCVNGGDLSGPQRGASLQTLPLQFFKPKLFENAEELYQRRVLTITGICVALLVVGMVCVVAYCKTKKQRKKIHGHLNQNVNQNQCVEQPNRMLANGPNHPGPGPEEIPMVDYISKNAPTTECSIIQHGPEEAVNYAGSRMSTRSHHSSTDGRLYRQPRRPRQPYLTESTGSLPSSPYHLPDDEAYETTQEYASSREPIRSRRRPRRNRLNGHVSQRAMGLRDNSSQSFSQSEEEEEEEEEEGQGESTPFLSMQNMNMEPCERGYRSSTAPAPTADIRTHRAQGRPSTRSNGHSKSSQSRSSKNDNAPL